MRYFGRPTQDQCANLTYLQYYEQFSVEKEQRKSKRRRSLNDGDNNEDSPSSPFLIFVAAMATTCTKRPPSVSAVYST